LEKKITEMEDAINDLEQIKDLNDELINTTGDEVKALKLDIDEKESQVRQSQKTIEKKTTNHHRPREKH